MKKTFWNKLFKKKRRPKKKMQNNLATYTKPKKHLAMPDRWEPPFTPQKSLLGNTSSKGLSVPSKPRDFELGKITGSVGIMVHMSLDRNFQIFVDECLDRFKAFDWGGINEKERLENERRLRTHTGEICGVYTDLNSGIQIWITSILEESITRMCLSEER